MTPSDQTELSETGFTTHDEYLKHQLRQFKAGTVSEKTMLRDIALVSKADVVAAEQRAKLNEAKHWKESIIPATSHIVNSKADARIAELEQSLRKEQE